MIIISNNLIIKSKNNRIYNYKINNNNKFKLKLIKFSKKIYNKIIFNNNSKFLLNLNKSNKKLIK